MSQYDEKKPEANNFADLATVWEYNGNKFDLDLGDAADADHAEAAFNHFAAAEKSLQKDGSIGDVIRGYDKMFRDLYDDLFGPGAGDAVLGDKQNIDNCNRSYESLLAFIDGQNAHFREQMESLNTRYSGNRAQRRASYRHG